MEKLGVQKEILYSELRDEEANLMQQIQGLFGDMEKNAEDRSRIEARLIQVRNKITELDMSQKQ
jgi:hypothetical protein